MDRRMVYPGALPADTDVLQPQVDGMLGIGWLAQGTFGPGTVAVGLGCTPTSPASLTVNIGPGMITALTVVDTTAFGSIAADSNPLVKCGINQAATPFTLTAPTTSGDSINYLIEAQFQEIDGTPVVLPYLNSADMTQPYSGPSNTGTAQNTVRQQVVGLQLLAGAAAPTGSQTTPGVTSGWVGLWVITVNYGQTQITSSSIAVAAGAPFGGGPFAPVRGEAVFTTSGSWTVPPGITRVRARVWAGGGGGGEGNTSTSAGGGGASGSYGEGSYTVAPGAVIPITVAPSRAGGNGGWGGGGGYARATKVPVTPGQAIPVTIAGGGPGGVGSSGDAPSGNSSFGSILSIGGAGGGSAGGSGSVGVGGYGGAASLSGAVGMTRAGTGGSNGILVGSSGGIAGWGGAPGDAGGLSPPAGPDTTAINGFNGVFPGGGGTGAIGTGTGGAGANGYALATW